MNGLTYSGLRQILRRAANRVGVEEPGAHDFHRDFCLALLRQGVDPGEYFKADRAPGYQSDKVICQSEYGGFAPGITEGLPSGFIIRRTMPPYGHQAQTSSTE